MGREFLTAGDCGAKAPNLKCVPIPAQDFIILHLKYRGSRGWAVHEDPRTGLAVTAGVCPEDGHSDSGPPGWDAALERLEGSFSS